MSAKWKMKNYQKYCFKVANKVVYSGATCNLALREKEHRAKWPTGYIVGIGGVNAN